MSGIINAFTLTLNPAIDRTLYLTELKAGELNRARSSVTMAGAKGINVSRMLSKLGVTAPALSFKGGKTGEMMAQLLKGEGVECIYVETSAETRVNTKIIEDMGVCTEINEAGGPVTTSELNALIEACYKLTDEFSTDCGELVDNSKPMWIIGGSIPQPVEKSVYKSVVKGLKERGAYVALDCDGEALRLGMQSKPDLIKPNAAELSRLTGEKVDSIESAIKVSHRLFSTEAVEILCTVGEKGAVYAGRDGVFTVDSPQVVVKGFAGAGDCFLASFLYKRALTSDIPASLAFAAAAAGAKVSLPCAAAPDPTLIERYADRKVVRVNNY